MLRNILGPIFNLCLDQILTYKMCYLFLCFAETPNFIVFFSKNGNFKETQKEQKTLSVNTTVLTALVEMSLFSAFFIFAVVGISIFSEVFLIGFQKSKNNKIPKQQKQKQQQ